MRVMLLHKLAEHIPENYVPPQKLIADVGKMVSDTPDAGLLRMTGGAAPNFPTASELALLGPNRQAEPQTKARGSLPGHCPSWARTRTLLIQRGHYNHPNSTNLRVSTRGRVTRCWGLVTLMPDFAVPYSLRC